MTDKSNFKQHWVEIKILKILFELEASTLLDFRELSLVLARIQNLEKFSK